MEFNARHLGQPCAKFSSLPDADPLLQNCLCVQASATGTGIQLQMGQLRQCASGKMLHVLQFQAVAENLVKNARNLPPLRQPRRILGGTELVLQALAIPACPIRLRPVLSIALGW